jgi:hypothetical protein
MNDWVDTSLKDLILSKENWYIIIEQDLIRCKEKFDTLKILAIHNHDDSKYDKKKLRVNYKTTQGDWSTSFGVYDVDKKDIPGLLRDAKINQILK